MWAPPRRSGVSGGSGTGAPSDAGPPPQRRPTPLHHLLRMGFPRHRAVKALAATGNKSVQLASDWLLTHVNDSTIDEDVSREYILYACPSGVLHQQFRDFWSRSEELCGRNGAHNFTPHITLVSFFKAPDECSLQLSKVLKRVIETAGPPPDDFLRLEPYSSPNFMGLFAAEEHAEYLKSLASHYVKEVSSSIGLTVDTYERLDALVTCFPWCAVPQEPPQPSICLEPHMKSLHITLAYQFSSDAYPLLKQLAAGLQPLERSIWELRLYSRDPRLATHQVHKVKHVYASKEPDELELRLGDYIYIEESVVENSQDGWVQGISWLTGMSGYLPIVYVERTAESDAWTLHKALPLGNQPSLETDNRQSKAAVLSLDSLSQFTNPADIEGTVADSGSQLSAELYIIESEMKNAFVKSNVEVFSPSPNDSKDNNEVSPSEGNDQDDKKCKDSKRELLVMRHGERVDFTFGSWVPYCFDKDDNYIRKDMNMPQSIPKRIGGSSAYIGDCPLTILGLLQARLVGEGLKASGTTISHVYSSPSYRCVQTAQAMLEGLGCSDSLKIKVEPSLFEWLVWYSKGPPTWMTVEELAAANLNVDLDYEPYMKLGETPFIQTEEDSECLEDCSQFYERNAKFTLHAIKNTDSLGGTIMLVGHASTLDTAWRGVSGLGPRECNSLGQLMRNVGYCSLAAMAGPPWNLVSPPCPPLMNTSNKRFDWKVLKDA